MSRSRRWGVLADARARAYVDGIAWHCYGGEVGAQSTVHEKYPDIETWMTECSGGGWSPRWSEVLSWMTGNLIIGNVRNWGRASISGTWRWTRRAARTVEAAAIAVAS